ncbi:MAG: hypothetical protein QXX99_07605 [Candidatus Bathyarchaeia archaeon]
MNYEDIDNIIKLNLTNKALTASNSFATDYYLIKILHKPESEDIMKLEILPKEFEKEKICPKCGEKSAFLKILERYYCFNCKKYVQ